MAATTIESLLNEARYDLNDFGGQKFDNQYLVHMYNRGVRILDRELINIHSDLTVHQTSGTLSTSANTLELDKTVDSPYWFICVVIS